MAQGVRVWVEFGSFGMCELPEKSCTIIYGIKKKIHLSLAEYEKNNWSHPQAISIFSAFA